MKQNHKSQFTFVFKIPVIFTPPRLNELFLFKIIANTLLILIVYIFMLKI